MQLFMKIVSLHLINRKLMLIFNTQKDLISHLNSISNLDTSIGFVPTMGALHQGHLSLLKEALLKNSIVVTSIFVNPTQFNNPEDLAKYPRTLEKDVEKIKSISDKIIVYAPSVDDIYEGQTVSKHFDFDGLENQMEGKFRPGHFDGVGTIVKRLFEIVKPNFAYFGEKDFQQLQIVKKLVKKLFL
jgi:pantoate--beta-alanine ligase